MAPLSPSSLCILFAATFCAFTLAASQLTNKTTKPSGYNRDPCTKTSDCQTPRACYDVIDNEQVLCPAGSTTCFCLSPNPNCKTQSDCALEESCLKAQSSFTCVSNWSNGPALNFEDCTSLSDCAFPRYCAELGSEINPACSASSESCACLASEITCTNSSDCQKGELCVAGDGSDICVSEVRIGASLNFEACRFNSDCRFPRYCSDFANFGGPCPEGASCACRTSLIECTSSECDKGESCVDGSTTKVCAADSTLGPGLNFEPCKTKKDCLFPRYCADLSSPDGVACSTNTSRCACLMSGGPCTSTENCNSGEECIKGDTANICASKSTLGPKLNFDACTKSSECRKPRYCADFSREIFSECDNTSLSCACRSGNPTCVNTSDCAVGESCTEGDTSNVCVSNLRLRPELKLNSEICSNSSNCLFPRWCHTIVRDEATSCEAGNNDVCFCLTANPGCASNLDCSSGESCLPNAGTKLECQSDRLRNIASLSDEQSSPNGSESGSVEKEVATAGCIAVSLLENIERHDLIHETHIKAFAFCDDGKNCATAGHIVVYKGEAMMMKTYCGRVGCTRQWMEVNSPKYRVALRVSSFTDGLEFTAFSARFETAAEEVVLSTATRVGL